MLSVLIPVYNYHVAKLVSEIHKQLCKEKIAFEIIAFDDGSEIKYKQHNETINQLSNTKLKSSLENIGRIASRAALAEAANFDWLLFLDADVFPKSSKFIASYLNVINKDSDAIFGGFAYHHKPPKNKGVLRWKYGRKYEEIPALQRNKNPHRIIISANFIIKKSCFKRIHSKMAFTGYGLDNFFALFTSELKLNVFHIDNEVYHLGLETNLSYLNKSKECISNLLYQNKANGIIAKNNKLLNTFISLKRIGLNYPLALAYKLIHRSLEHNILGKNPNMIAFQSYKLLYIAYTDVTK